jgi:hypothetical protein
MQQNVRQVRQVRQIRKESKTVKTIETSETSQKSQTRQASQMSEMSETCETSETSETCKIINTIRLFFKKHNVYVFLKKFFFLFSRKIFKAYDKQDLLGQVSRLRKREGQKYVNFYGKS